MNHLPHTPETQAQKEPEQDAKDCPDATRLSEAEYATLRDWLETHHPPLKLSKELSSILSQGNEEAALKDYQAPLRDWLQEIYSNVQAPLHDCPTPLRNWLLSTQVHDTHFEPTGEPSRDPETPPPHYYKDMLLRLINSLSREITARYEKEYGASPHPRMKYACTNCEHDLWLAEKDPWICYWCEHRVLLKPKG